MKHSLFSKKGKRERCQQAATPLARAPSRASAHEPGWPYSSEALIGYRLWEELRAGVNGVVQWWSWLISRSRGFSVWSAISRLTGRLPRLQVTIPRPQPPLPRSCLLFPCVTIPLLHACLSSLVRSYESRSVFEKFCFRRLQAYIPTKKSRSRETTSPWSPRLGDHLLDRALIVLAPRLIVLL